MSGKIVKGVKTNIERETRGFGQYFFEAAEKHGEKICQINATTGHEESFRSVKRRSTRAAVHMRRLGINEEHVVLFCTKNTLDGNIPFLASLYLGAKVASIDPSQAVRDCIHCISLVNPKFIFVEEDSVELIENCVNELTNKPDIVVIGRSDKYKTFSDLQLPTKEEIGFKPFHITNCEDAAMIYFSSGTTGLPKAICLKHRKLDAVRAVLTMDHYNTSVLMHFSSLYWISAALMITLSFITGGCRVLAQKFDPQICLQLIEKYKVTYLFLPPISTYRLTNLPNAEKYDTSSLYGLMLGGSPVSPEQLIRTRQLFKHTYVTVGYGSTEAATMITGFDYTRDKLFLDKKLTSTGRCGPDMEIKIVDVDTRKLLGPNQKGEICFKCEYSMKDYYNQDASDCFDEDGFIKTGDIGYYDEDEFFYVIDRIKEMFKYKSWHVVPSALEALLQEHPAVHEAAVFGLPHEIDEFHPAACIVLKPNCTVGVEELTAFVSGQVAEWHKLRGGIKFVKFLPKSPTGKFQRRELLKLFLSK